MFSPFCLQNFVFPQIPGARRCGNKWHFPYFWLMLSVSSSLRLSVALDKENSVGQKGQVRPWHGACRTAQIREPIREVWQMVIIITVREWGHLFIILPFIYLFIYSESSTYLIRDVWQNKIPWVFPEVVKMVRKSPEFSRFSLIFSKKSLFPGFPGFPWAVRTLWLTWQLRFFLEWHLGNSMMWRNTVSRIQLNH